MTTRPSQGSTDTAALADGPVIPRRLIARELRQLRVSRDLNLEQLAAETDVSTSTLSRLENAQGTASPLTIKALVRYYQVEDTPVGQNLTSWARAGRKPGWWRRYPGAEGEVNPSYIAFETQAKIAKIYAITNVPVMFQTRNYALVAAKRLNRRKSDAEIDSIVKFRLQRQGLLVSRDGGQPPLEVHAVLHELALKQRVGSPLVMREQAEALLRHLERDKKRDRRDGPGRVSIRILPEEAPVSFGMVCPWALLEYENDLPAVCFLESHLGMSRHEDEEVVCRASEDFDQLVQSSLNEDNSAEFIRGLIANAYWERSSPWEVIN